MFRPCNVKHTFVGPGWLCVWPCTLYIWESLQKDAAKVYTTVRENPFQLCFCKLSNLPMETNLWGWNGNHCLLYIYALIFQSINHDFYLQSAGYFDTSARCTDTVHYSPFSHCSPLSACLVPPPYPCLSLLLSVVASPKKQTHIQQTAERVFIRSPVC